MFGQKGESSKEALSMVSRIISALLFLALIALTIGTIVPPYFDSGRVEGSAHQLSEAINEVYLRAEDYGDISHTKTVSINIPSSKDDWEWIVYSGFNPHELQLSLDQALYDWPGQCEDVCHGFMRAGLPHFELVNPDAVQDFVLLDPCKAKLEVYYDGKVRLRFLADSVEGFCCSEDKIIPTSLEDDRASAAKRNVCKFQEN